MKTLLALLVLPALATAARAAEAPLKIDRDRSSVEIVVKATVDSFVGKLEGYDAAVMVDTENGEVRGARFAFRFADVKTGDSARDAQMNSWQDTPRHPDGSFTLASLTPRGPGAWTAKGTLMLHDVSREISFPVFFARKDGGYVLDGDAVLDTQDFGLPVIRKFMLLKVDPHVHVRFHLLGALDGPGS